MSNVRDRFLTDTITVWRLEGYDPSDPYASQSYSAPVTYPANYIEGGAMSRDANGVEFSPSYTIRLKAVDVRFKDFIFLGESTDLEPPSNAEVVRLVKGNGTPLVGTRDLTVYTG